MEKMIYYWTIELLTYVAISVFEKVFHNFGCDVAGSVTIAQLHEY